ncbi:hypothetical protein BdWA1_000155 [Babesia duncani]|uniref:Uncharacterized protein n=1 Tax=Babesia duncani TaxID=323732 RepID=A0AAD9UPN5_9APIC|nr:hypothetical protein BdWA1_000155 [Babesia duncani]
MKPSCIFILLITTSICVRDFQIANTWGLVFAKPAHESESDQEDFGNDLKDEEDEDSIDHDLDEAEDRLEELDKEIEDAEDYGLKETIEEETEEAAFAKRNISKKHDEEQHPLAEQLVDFAEQLNEINAQLRDL